MGGHSVPGSGPGAGGAGIDAGDPGPADGPRFLLSAAPAAQSGPGAHPGPRQASRPPGAHPGDDIRSTGERTAAVAAPSAGGSAVRPGRAVSAPGRDRGRRSYGRAIGAAVLSALIPGAGQLYLRAWARAAAMLAVSLLFVGIALRLTGDRAALAGLLLRPNWLLGLLAVDAALLVFRIACVVDAFQLGAPPSARRKARAGAVRSRRPWPVAAALAVIVAFTVLPHPVAGYYDLQTYDLVTSVFGNQQPGASASGGNGGAPVVTKTPGRLTVLLLGGDAGQGRESVRTDTMIVASVDMATGRAAMFGLPRNMINVPLPEPAASHYDCACFPDTLNALYRFAEEEHPEWFPGSRNAGVNAIVGAAEKLTGLPIDHYAMVDLRGFVEIVDALGGVTVTVTKPIHIEVESNIEELGLGRGGPAYTLKPGRRHLDGLTALAYVRSRKTTSDYDRMRRQRCLLSTLADQAGTGRILRGFPRLAKAIKSNVKTDLPTQSLPQLIDMADSQGVQVTTIGITPPAFTDGYERGYPIPDVKRIRKAVADLIRKPAAATPGAPTQTTVRPKPTTTTSGGDAGGGSTGTTKAPSRDIAQTSDACDQIS
jgi:LCP family protein required for cell wall assembly